MELVRWLKLQGTVKPSRGKDMVVLKRDWDGLLPGARRDMYASKWGGARLNTLVQNGNYTVVIMWVPRYVPSIVFQYLSTYQVRLHVVTAAQLSHPPF